MPLNPLTNVETSQSLILRKVKCYRLTSTSSASPYENKMCQFFPNHPVDEKSTVFNATQNTGRTKLKVFFKALCFSTPLGIGVRHAFPPLGLRALRDVLRHVPWYIVVRVLTAMKYLRGVFNK